MEERAKQKVRQITDDLVHRFGTEIVSVIKFGSARGEQDIELSDIDLLIICKDVGIVKAIRAFIRNKEKKFFHTSHSNFSNFLERYFLGSNKLGGIHAIIISQNELDEKARIKSSRLKMLTAVFISYPVFIYQLKHNAILLYGRDFISPAVIPPLKFGDKIRAFTLPILILMLAPLSSFNRKKFIVWCSKAVKYFNDYTEVYAKLLSKTEDHLTDLGVNQKVMEHIIKYRYVPETYQGSRILLYFSSWLSIMKQTPFILSRQNNF